MFVPFEVAVAVTVGLVIVLAPIFLDDFVRRFRAAGREDARWAEARGELGETGREIAAVDTRLMRGWGPSSAGPAFTHIARSEGHGWLEPTIASLTESTPFSIRAVAGELEGTKVAFLVARTRREGIVSKRLALGPAGPVEEAVDSCVAPPEDFARDLAALARTTLSTGKAS